VEEEILLAFKQKLGCSRKNATMVVQKENGEMSRMHKNTMLHIQYPFWSRKS
jgi:hypothetical protein